MNDPCFDIAHLGHVEIFSNKFEESIHFFSKVYGLTITEQNQNSVYFRAFDDYEHHTLKLTKNIELPSSPCLPDLPRA